MPSLPKLKIPPIPNPKLSLGSRSGADVVGLDIQPGLVAAVQARVDGAVLAQRAAALPLAGDAVREGEVFDQETLADTLRELFESSGLARRVRIGVANQRTVMRTLELPPVTEGKDLAAAVRFQAQDQVPMPLADAVLDYHSLGMVETPAGPRQRVLLVAAQRDMVQRLLAAAAAAGLRPEGIDLSAFALIRSLHRAIPEAHADQGDRVLYLNVDGLTNLAIADGTTCRFTRVVGGGIEALASELAERRGISLADARGLITAVDLGATEQDAGLAAADAQSPEVSSPAGLSAAAAREGSLDVGDIGASGTEAVAAAEALAGASRAPREPDGPDAAEPPEGPTAGRSIEDHEAHEASMSFAELSASSAPAEPPLPVPPPVSDADVRALLENGIRELAGQVRTSLDFHRSQDGGGEVSHVVLSGAALDVAGFAEALETSLGLDVRAESVGLANENLRWEVSTHRLAVAAGLATVEAPR
ncbi:MAG TPA: pilus assembly protein PilM [Solirubrobacteraceae bacterium]|nr:pilus assembly protein PilM [Solirubrobacteraceae bacterium]